MLLSVDTLPLAVTSTLIVDGCGITLATGIKEPCAVVNSAEISDDLVA